MPRLRTKGKTSGPPVEPERTTRTRRNRERKQSPRNPGPGPRIEVHIRAESKTTSRQSTVQATSHNKAASSRGRITRSNKGREPLTKLPSPSRTKRRPTVTETEDKPAKRQRRLSYKPESKLAEEEEGEEESQPDQENKEAAEDSILPKQDFFDGINSNLGVSTSYNKITRHRPKSSDMAPVEKDSRKAVEVERPTLADVEEENETNSAAVESTEKNQAPFRRGRKPKVIREQPQVVEQEAPETEEPVLQPDTSQGPSLRSSQPKKRRQSKKPTFGEADYSTRGPSPELGSTFPPSPATQATTSNHVHVDRDPYDIPSDDEQPSQPIPKKMGKEMHVSSAKDKQGEPKQTNQGHSQPGQEGSPVPSEHQEERQQENEEEQEENDQTYNSSDDERIVEQEVDISNLAEDSLVLDAPPRDSETGGPVPTACIKREWVQTLMYVMTLRGWMGKRLWPEKVLELAKVQAEALAENPNSTMLSRIILAKLSDLYELCEEIPPALRSEQLAFLRDNTKKLSSLISTLRHAIDRFVSRINTIMDQGDEEQVKVGYTCVTKIHRRIIPMLVLVLDITFQAGSREPRGSSKRAATQKGDFTVYLLEPLERAAGWAQRLSHVVENWYELHHPRRESDKEDISKEHRKRFSVATKDLKKVLGKARDDIDALKRAPTVRKKAMERDEAIRREREEDAQRRRDMQDLQMQRFLQSVSQIRSSQPRPRIGSFRQAVSSARPSATHSELVASQESLDDSYFEEHGWHYWEDDQLLSLIRTTSHPNFNVFRRILPDRDSDELRERSRYLRMVMRDKYQRKGISPPGWCMAED
ncbi:hypothetical protein F53441_4513 [Fusarium austroafricanum]|uniref:Uncharacterized protein n=1 Tax=Fusarium austroafricanum TaxID=2364996 RepID=A0A8H4KLV6_9HYPO|nr:hypothetical protein F53441_4513 [Fusarium austroafricanum]